MEPRPTDSRTRARDAGLARLRRTTRVTIFGATALAGAVAALAAHSAPGHKSAIVTSARSAAKPTRRATRPSTTTPVPSDDQQPVQSEPAPAVAPAPTTVAPVTVTGGS